MVRTLLLSPRYDAHLEPNPSDTYFRVTPPKGSIHDVKAFDTHEILGHLNARNIIADKGYIGRGLHTPTRTQPGRKLTGPEKDHNQRINHIRWPIERAIAHLKTWRIFHTIYRRPYSTFQTTVNAITGIIFGIL